MATNVLSFPVETERPSCGRPGSDKTCPNRIPVSEGPRPSLD